MLRLRFSAAYALFTAFAAVAACSVYDESLLGAGGGGTADGDEDEDGEDEDGSGARGGGSEGGAGPTSAAGTQSSTGSSPDAASTGIGSTGSVTTGGQCETPEDCPGEDSECAARACEEGMCSITAEVQGVEISRQTDGDCLVQVCDGAGGIETLNDDADLPDDDGDDCTESACVDGSPEHPLVDEGADCDQDGGAFCTVDGLCVECLIDDDCVGDDRCSELNACVSPACDDGIPNGDETDTDCGGLVCDPCINGDTCEVNGDCVSNLCAGTCQPSCTDGEVGPDETDVDCGGVCPFPCLLGQSCEIDDDCDSDQCLSTVCRPRLFFSEYVEGSSNNKAVEIFNWGNVPVDLTAANCAVKIYANGNTTASTIGLQDSVTEGEVYLLCHSSASFAGSCDRALSTVNFNGNDAVALECMGIQLDVIGQIGTDPGSGGWGTNPTNTLDNTLRRLGSILEGDPNGADAFDPATEWEGFPVDTFDDLGQHF